MAAPHATRSAPCATRSGWRRRRRELHVPHAPRGGAHGAPPACRHRGAPLSRGAGAWLLTSCWYRFHCPSWAHPGELVHHAARTTRPNGGFPCEPGRSTLIRSDALRASTEQRRRRAARRCDRGVAGPWGQDGGLTNRGRRIGRLEGHSLQAAERIKTFSKYGISRGQ